MPKLELTIPADSLSEEAQGELARDLGAALLRAEGAPDTEFFRSITWAHVHALPSTAMQTPDGVAEPHAVIEISVPDGALSEKRKAGLVEQTTKLVLAATGWDAADSWRIWTLIRDVPEGNWGAGGQVVRFQQLREAATAEREREGSGSEKLAATAKGKQGVTA
ncbi:MAG TPA: tautomerase family protein [Solirubrobacterales bacterium]|nr:tautomerase family protein [Solirubrobacterales bacterium]